MRYITLAIAFLIGMNAQAQIIRAEPFYTAPAEAAAPSYAYLLDTFTGAYVGYSLRKLDNNYTGSAIRVRRKSDNTEQDIGFVNNHLDTAALKTFAGTGATDTAFIVTWYNQADSSGVFGVRNQTQATAINQPRILTSGVIDRQGGNPCVIFDGSNDFTAANNASSNWNFLHDGTINTSFTIGRFGSVADPELNYLIFGTSFTIMSPGGFQLLHDTRSSQSRDDVMVNISSSAAGGLSVLNVQTANTTLANTHALIYLKADTDNATAANRSELGTNGGTAQKNNAESAAIYTGNARHAMQIGAAQNSSGVNSGFLNGAIQEIIIYNSDKSSNRTGIESNINSFYSIY